MKTDKSKKSWNIAIAMVVIVPVMVIPVPTIILNILMAINLFLDLAIFLAVVFTGCQRRKKGNEDKIIFGKTDIFYHFPTVFILCAIFELVVYAHFTRLILTNGTGVDNKIMLFFSGLIDTSGSAGVIIGFVSIITICVAVIVATKKCSARVTEAANRFLDIMPEMVTAMERTYACDKISEKTFIARKDNIVQQAYFLGTMDGAGKFITGNTKVMFFIMAAGIFGSIIIGTWLHEQAIRGVVEISIIFGISGGIIFLLPQLLLSIAMSIVSSRVYEFSIRQW
jgi:flagellar biosynthesis protein FlhA